MSDLPSAEKDAPVAVHFLPYGSYVAACGRIEDQRFPERWSDLRRETTCGECQAQMADHGDLPRPIPPGSGDTGYDHPPCCDACDGQGATMSGPCPDCLGTGHAHAPEFPRPDERLDAPEIRCPEGCVIERVDGFQCPHGVGWIDLRQQTRPDRHPGDEVLSRALETVDRLQKQFANADAATDRVYAAIVGIHDRGYDCGDLVGHRSFAEEIARAVLEGIDG